MNIDKHTPGPWFITNELSAVVIEAKGALICEMYVHDEADANTRLIAAAPDMLAALRDIVEHGSIMRAQQIARAAIAKAEGRDD